MGIENELLGVVVVDVGSQPGIAHSTEGQEDEEGDKGYLDAPPPSQALDVQDQDICQQSSHDQCG